MKANYNNNSYFVAVYGIEGSTLYTALADGSKGITAIAPVKKNFNGSYAFASVPCNQNCVDNLLNDVLVSEEGSSEKLSIKLNTKESVVCSDGTTVFAFSRSLSALHYATQQIYENLKQFRAPCFTSYCGELGCHMVIGGSK